MFLDKLFALLETYPGQLDHLELDHICYRVATAGDYETVKKKLAQSGRLLAESTVGGRAIATFRLTEPWHYGDRRIDILELPAPKPGRPYPTGFEHVEFVTDRPLPAFVDFLVGARIASRGQIDLSGMDKASNADVRVRLGPGVSVKFHEQSLADVIALEQPQ